MSAVGRTHDRALRLAAALLDFGLAEGEREELEGHLDACPACRHSAGLMRADAAVLRLATVPVLPSRRVDEAVYAEIAGRGRRRPFGGTLVLVAASLVLVAAMGVASAGAVLLGIWPPRVEEVPSPPAPAPSTVVPPTPAPSIETWTPRPDAAWTVVPGTLPVATGSVQLAPGPNGGLYVLVNEPAGAIVALLDAAGEPRPGWPTVLPGWTCDTPAPPASWSPAVAGDGSMRLVCHDDGTEGDEVTAFAFDAAGQPLAGWPVLLPAGTPAASRIVDGDLLLVVGEADGYRLVRVGADGLLRIGERVAAGDPTAGVASIGPDGTARVLAGNDITAFDQGGIREGWPIRVEGTLSALADGPDGRVYLTSSPDATTTRLLAIERDGRIVEAGPGALPIAGTGAWSGAGPAGRPLAPLVATDGTAYVVGEVDAAAVVYGIDPSGAVMPGWPYRAGAPLAWQGTCPEGSTGCGVARATPAVSPDGVLYLPLAGATGGTAPGSVVAVGRDGQVVTGWPVGLVRSGAAFWTVVAATDETAYALAVEPEAGRGPSATVIDIASDSSVRFRTTVVGPTPP